MEGPVEGLRPVHQVEQGEVVEGDDLGGGPVVAQGGELGEGGVHKGRGRYHRRAPGREA